MLPGGKEPHAVKGQQRLPFIRGKRLEYVDSVNCSPVVDCGFELIVFGSHFFDQNVPGWEGHADIVPVEGVPQPFSQSGTGIGHLHVVLDPVERFIVDARFAKAGYADQGGDFIGNVGKAEGRIWAILITVCGETEQDAEKRTECRCRLS